MKIEAGKCYRTRDGQKVGPMIADYPGFIVKYGDGQKWEASGATVLECRMPKEMDLIAEWTDAPDLTAITTPFGLLDRETQEALKAHGGPWEHFFEREWRPTIAEPGCWADHLAYRVKPAPPKPREWWISIDRRGSKHVFDVAVAGDNHEIVRVREVLPETN